MDVSKNHQTEEDVRRITERALGVGVLSSSPLTAGQCNALYDVRLEDGGRCVLKVAPSGDVRLRRGEAWLMKTEIFAMRLAADLPGVPVPRVLFADDSRTVCSAPYFIMEYAKGHPAAADRKSWTPDEKDDWYRRFGAMIRRISAAESDRFGIAASGREFGTLSGFVGDLLEMILADLTDFGVETGADPRAVLARFPSDEDAFREVRVPRLVHYDFWENNVMIEGDRITALIDWERALFGDPLMEDRFRGYAICPALLEGYGKSTLTEAEERRCLWYDLIMDGCLMADVFVRQYADDGQYRWARKLFEEVWDRLK